MENITIFWHSNLGPQVRRFTAHDAFYWLTGFFANGGEVIATSGAYDVDGQRDSEWWQV